MTIGVSHGGGSNILTADAPSDEALVGTVNGVVRIVRGAAGWTETERTLEGKHIHALVQDPKSGAWFCGVEHGGIYASEDDGHTWEKRDVGITAQDIYSLSVAEVNGATRVFAGDGARAPVRERRPGPDVVGEARAPRPGDGGVGASLPRRTSRT